MMMVSGLDIWESLYHEFRLDWAHAAEFADRADSVFRVGVAVPHVVYYSPLTGLNLSPLIPSHDLTDRDREDLLSFYWRQYGFKSTSWLFCLSSDGSCQSPHYYEKMYQELVSDLESGDHPPYSALMDWLSPDGSFSLYGNPFDPDMYWSIRGADLTDRYLFRDEVRHDVPFFYFIVPPVDFRAFMDLVGFSESDCIRAFEGGVPVFDGMRLRSVIFALVQEWNRYVVESLPSMERLAFWASDGYWSEVLDDLPFRLDRVLIVNGVLLKSHYVFGFVYRGVCFVPMDRIVHSEPLMLVDAVDSDWLEWWRSSCDAFTEWVVRLYDPMFGDRVPDERFSMVLHAPELDVDVLAFAVPEWGLGYMPQLGRRSCFYDGDDGVFLYSFIVIPEWDGLPPAMQVLRDRERVEWSGQLALDV